MIDRKEITVVICCAGMGTRLGIGTTKALVNVCDRPLIIRQLEMLEKYDDIRIVVGYQAEKVINLVKEYRQDVMFAFNYDFATTGVAASLSKGLVGTRKYVVSIDGDVLVNPYDFNLFMEYPGECIGVCTPYSDEAVYACLNNNNQVIYFNKEHGNIEWSGVAKMKSERLEKKTTNVFDMITPILPVTAFQLRAREINTPDDFDRMVEWVKNGYVD